jgi:hypothetical protein
MRAIADCINQELVWVQPKLLEGEYELRQDGGEPVALLQRHGSSRAEGMVEEGSFSFQRLGFWRPKIVVVKGKTQEPVAVLSSLGDGATLDFADSRRLPYVWKKVRPLGWEYLWMDSAGKPVVYAHAMTMDSSVKLSFEPQASQIADLGLLVLLAEFLVILARQNAIMVAAGVAAGV